MTREDVLKQITTPIGSPAFARGPRMFYNREYLNIMYRSDPEALRKVVPEPLEIDDPLVRFEVMNMPDTMTHGAYIECGQAIAVRLGQEHGEYLHAMYVNNHPAIASGREVAAYPKKLASPNFYIDVDALVGTLDYGTIRVAVATMGYKYIAGDLDRARGEICVPTYMLKILPNYLSRHGGRPRICELIRTQIDTITVKGAWTGPARLQLFEHVCAPLADLPVREIVAASHVVTDLLLPAAEVVHDYLAE
ncbi:MAG: acetoacetate decarboxylase [Acetobacteraceae bacterium]|nr:acetoacetate decarboxylase [Acetobacteraceae bacterium]MBV8521039.1 acetoacetate decarboxylase [Acetobacteraceae bacterium]